MARIPSGSSRIEPSLIEKARNGNLDPLARCIFRLLVRTLRRSGLTLDRAEDIAQERVVGLMTRIVEGEVQPGAAVVYLQVSARREAARHRDRREVPFEVDLHGGHEGRSAELQLLEAELARRVRMAIERLPEADRELVERHYLEGTPLAELKGDGSMDALYKRHERARTRLRKFLAEALAA